MKRTFLHGRTRLSPLPIQDELHENRIAGIPIGPCLLQFSVICENREACIIVNTRHPNARRESNERTHAPRSRLLSYQASAPAPTHAPSSIPKYARLRSRILLKARGCHAIVWHSVALWPPTSSSGRTLIVHPSSRDARVPDFCG